MGSVLRLLMIGFLFAGLGGFSTARGEEKPSKVKVVATLFPFSDWAAKIGGDRVEVITLLKPGTSPHTYELTTKDIKDIQNAKLLIYNGSGLDNWVLKNIEKTSDSGLIKLPLAQNLPLAPMPAVVEGEDHEEGAPHHDHGHHHDDSQTGCGMWLDPMRAVRMIDLITQSLVEIDPQNEEYYRNNAKNYWGQLDRLDRLYRSKLEPKKGGVICFHADFVYLFRRYGVEVYGIVEPYPGKEPSVDYMKKLTDLVSGKPLQFVLTEPQLSSKPAQVLADQLKVRVVNVDPMGGQNVPNRDSYISLMTYNLYQLTDQERNK